ncbi:hypothetical protein QEV12_04450 [Trueperella pyogenes]|uniref:hypothetical protein n=1 Tax=Trueperella pyogenes TaxID=1661 RepID=UPI00324632C9
MPRHIKGEPEKIGLEMEKKMGINADEMRALRESLEQRTKTLEALADAVARQTMAEEQLADAYQEAISAGWAKAELADAGVKEPPLVRRRRLEKERGNQSAPVDEGENHDQ